jgi:hypothetical protein
MTDTRPLSERLDAAWVLAQTDSGGHVDPGLLHEAATLARRVESAQVGVLYEEWFLLNDQQELIDSRPMLGKRVALVEVE